MILEATATGCQIMPTHQPLRPPQLRRLHLRAQQQRVVPQTRVFWRIRMTRASVPRGQSLQMAGQTVDQGVPLSPRLFLLLHQHEKGSLMVVIHAARR